MTGGYDMDEAIRRVQAFDAAGADGIYVPLPPTMEDLKRVVAATTKPVNVLAAGRFAKFTRAEFAAAGVARISLGSSLARVTHRAIFEASEAMFQHGDFSPLTSAMLGDKVDALIKQKT